MVRVEPLLIKHFDNAPKPIAKIPGSPCVLSGIVAFDLNEIKVVFCRIKGIANQMPSVNAVIFSRNGKILFIEFKRADPDKLAAIKCLYFVQDFVNKLPNKVLGSIELLDLICRDNGIIPDPGKYNSIYLVDLNDQDFQSYIANTAAHRNISFVTRTNPSSVILSCRWFAKYLETA
jgi:hypothetical protein